MQNNSRKMEQVRLLTTLATMEFSFSKLFSFFCLLAVSRTEEPAWIWAPAAEDDCFESCFIFDCC